MEAGDEDISFLIYSDSPFKMEGLYIINLEKNIFPTDYVNEVTGFIAQNRFLSMAVFSSIKVFYNFSTSTLVPLEYFKEELKEEMMSQMFVPDKMKSCFSESCKYAEIKNIYSIPTFVHNKLKESFPLGKFAHSTSYQLSKTSETILECIVYNASIKIIFYKEGQLQLVQYFDYTTATDVCYHLLNVAERFEVAAATIQLILSGMIDVNSTLYQEVYKYFLHVKFTTCKDVAVAEGFEGLPSHFYNHLTALAHAHN